MDLPKGMPPGAKRVFKGVIFDVYQWPQEMFDGSSATYERVVRIPTADVIAIKDGRILSFVQEQPLRPPYPSLIGGHLEEGEEPLACAKREMLEEAGWESDDWELIAEYWGQSKILFHQWVYVARDCRAAAEPKPDPGERFTPVMKGFEEFLALARDPRFAIPSELRFEMYEALLDAKKREALRRRILRA